MSAMKKEYALFNLAEAKQAIEQLMEEMASDPEYDYGNYVVDMQHIYWHINSAWNGRDFDSTSTELTDKMYEAFIQFPADMVL
jgi:hypothetical protein